MAFNVIVLCICLVSATIQATEVNISNVWKENIGWEVTCSWKLFANDSLQSVRLYNNDQQFLIYRPEIDGDSRAYAVSLPEDTMMVNCATLTQQGVTGTCVLTMELLQPQRNSFLSACEVSGERPTFRMEKKAVLVDAFGPPTEAVVEVGSVNDESGRVMLNCTSSGLLRPSLTWTIGDRKVPHDFTGGAWNATSKLWNVWSLLSYTPSTNKHTAICTPEISTGGQLVKGNAAEYSSAVHPKSIGKIIFTAAFLLLLI